MRPLPATVHQMLMGLREVVGPELHQAIVVWVTQMYEHDAICDDYTHSHQTKDLLWGLQKALLKFQQTI